MHLVVVTQPALLLVTVKQKATNCSMITFRSTMANRLSPMKSYCRKAAVCALYVRLQEYDVNGLRHTMFGSRTTDPAKLPPCKDACDQHIKRANYQAAIWRHNHQCYPLTAMVELLTETFWYIGRTVLQLHRQYLNVSAPQAVLERVSSTGST